MGDVVAGAVNRIERKNIDRVDRALARLDRRGATTTGLISAPELIVLPRAAIPIVPRMRRMGTRGRQRRRHSCQDAAPRHERNDTGTKPTIHD